MVADGPAAPTGAEDADDLVDRGDEGTRRAPVLFIDADACPVTREAIACARSVGVPCVVCGDSGHNLTRHVRPGDPTDPEDARGGFWVRVLSVPAGPDSADFAIVSELEEHDVVVTQDMGLASMALGRGCAAIDVRGRVFDRRTIDALLLVRHATKAELRSRRRRGRPDVGRHEPFSADDRERFQRRLHQLLLEARAATRG